jgi:hypothetical protein
MTIEDWYRMNEKVFKDAKDGERCPCRRQAKYEDCCKDWWVRLKASAEDVEVEEKPHEFEKLLEYLKLNRTIENYEYDRNTGTGKIKPRFSMRPILHFQVREDWEIP